MALSYSLYTAASTFLVQAQSSHYFDFNCLPELQYCVRALQEVSTVNLGTLSVVK